MTEQEKAIVDAAVALRYGDWSSNVSGARVEMELWHDLVDAVELYERATRTVGYPQSLDTSLRYEA